jgi:hypothetical protein
VLHEEGYVCVCVPMYILADWEICSEFDGEGDRKTLSSKSFASDSSEIRDEESEEQDVAR